MTLKQVSQRAYDYAAAAQVCEKRQGSYTARAKKMILEIQIWIVSTFGKYVFFISD